MFGESNVGGQSCSLQYLVGGKQLTEEIRRLLPAQVRKTSGFKAGDEVEVKAIGGVVTFVGKPSEKVRGDDFTQAQRQAVKAEVKAARKGPYHGPFKTTEEFATYFKAYKRRRGKDVRAKTR